MAGEGQVIGAKPPYAAAVQTLGANPKPMPDVPVTAVFLALFLISAICNQTLFVRNKLAGHKFVFSGAMFGFSTIRVASCALRIAWAYHPASVNLAIAAQIFVEAGTVILYILNLFLSQRLMRARHPHIGWTKPFTLFMGPVVIGITFIALLMIIICGIQSYFTQDPNTLRIDSDMLLAGITEFAVAAFIPIIVILVMLAIPRRSYIDKFGNGKYKTKVGIAMIGAVLISLGSAFRAGTAWLPAASVNAEEKWYNSRTCFYIFDYGLEIIVLYMYLISRVDKRFYVPDGAQGAGAYSGDVVAEDTTRSWDYEAYMRYHENNYESDGVTLGDDSRSTKAPSYLEMDERSGKWSVREMSHVTLASTLRDVPEEGYPRSATLTPVGAMHEDATHHLR